MGDSFPTLTLFISACLAGQPVRYNGLDKYSTIYSILEPYVTWQTFCPEMQANLGVPRPPIEQRVINNQMEVVEVNNPHITHTVAISQAVQIIAAKIATVAANGLVLMPRSPSCALHSSTIKNEMEGSLLTHQPGYTVRFLQQQLPNLPLIEEQDLQTNDYLLQFLVQCYCLKKWQNITQYNNCSAAKLSTKSALYRFHGQYKYQLMASDPKRYKLLGAALAKAGQASKFSAEFIEWYFAELMRALRQPISHGRHLNTLLHISGYFKELDPPTYEHLHSLIQDFQMHKIEWITVITFIQQCLTTTSNHYLMQQVYLYPVPSTLLLSLAMKKAESN